jgi:hypothetical protein
MTSKTELHKRFVGNDTEQNRFFIKVCSVTRDTFLMAPNEFSLQENAKSS